MENLVKMLTHFTWNQSFAICFLKNSVPCYLPKSIMATHNETGKTGEMLAIAYLQKLGYLLLETNWKCGRYEVDLIMSNQKTLHFVEVKTLAGSALAYPERRVDRHKITRMKRVAEHYLQLHPDWKFIQFDVLGIHMVSGEPESYFLQEDVS